VYVPEVAARLCVEDYEIPIGIAGKDDAPRGREGTSVRTAEVRKGPFLRSGANVDGLQCAGRSLIGIRNVNTSQEVVARTIGLRRTREDVALG
jgi:hypothetical protein